MKRRTKTLTAAALALMLTFSGNATARAASSISASIDGGAIKGYCEIGSTQGHAITNFSKSPSLDPHCSVSATYVYINVETFAVGTKSGSSTGNTGCGVGFSAPEGCRSVRIDAYHSASLDTQSWSGSTSAIY